MSQNSKIEWTDATWNPVTGCTEVSPGCDHCYAKTFAERWRDIPGHPYEHGFDVMLRPERLRDPYRWRKPKMVFVNSMSDLFHKDIPDEFIRDVFETMAKTVFCPYRHTYQVLTKRPERMRRLLPKIWDSLGMNDAQIAVAKMGIWLGVSIESADYAWRADMLRETPAAVRFLSLEPLLGPIPGSVIGGMDWVIVGGESGAGARPMDLQWARDIRDASRALNIPYFLKQLGGVRDKRGGDDAVLDGQRWTQFPLTEAIA